MHTPTTVEEAAGEAEEPLDTDPVHVPWSDSGVERTGEAHLLDGFEDEEDGRFAAHWDTFEDEEHAGSDADWDGPDDEVHYGAASLGLP